MEAEITKIGERGQVVIPQSFRENMGIHKGEKFMVLERGDMIILKRLRVPTKEDIDRMLVKTQSHAKKHQLTEKDMWNAIERVRSKKE